MKLVLSLVLVALLSQGFTHVNAGTPTYYHLFRDGCNISSAAFGAILSLYTGPSPPAGWQDCIVTTSKLIFCIDMNSEFSRAAIVPAQCGTVTPYPYCPSVKGATWGMLCDKPSNPRFTGTVPVGFKYCVGNSSNRLDACAEVTSVNFGTKFKFGFFRGADSETAGRGVARFVDEMEGGDMIKTEEKTAYPILLDNVPLRHCVFRDGGILGCRPIENTQYKDQLPYLGFTGVFFRDGSETQGYIPAIPTLTGLQYAMASVFQFFADNIFVSTNLTP